MKVIAVIPARFGATRFPGKPLAKATGKYLVQHVYEQSAKCSAFNRVIVATDDERIAAAVKSFGGEVAMTRADHVSGTDRVGEVADGLDLSDSDLVLNVQGDEPEMEPGSLERLVCRMKDITDGANIGTLASPFDDAGPREGSGSPLDPGCVKVVTDLHGRALYFSRSAIPYPRDTQGVVDRPSRWLLHMGVYAFRAETLRRISGGRMAPSVLEKSESLEQLRWMQHGLSIAVVTVERGWVGIDTPEDYAALVARCKNRSRER